MPNIFSEESGEISLSVLSRSQATKRGRDDINSTSDQYKLSRIHYDLLRQEEQERAHQIWQDRHRTVKQSDESIALLVQHFTKIINDMTSLSWKHYALPEKAKRGARKKKKKRRIRKKNRRIRKNSQRRRKRVPPQRKGSASKLGPKLKWKKH